MDRRTFLRAGAGAALLLPRRLQADQVLSDPYAPPSPGRIPAQRAIRVKGRVTCQGQALRGVRVTDGVSVVRTGADGSYALTTGTTRPFVHVCVPAGHEIPLNPTGTSRFYRALPSQGGEVEASWDLEPLTISDDRHALLLLADPQTQTADEMRQFHEQTVPDVMETVRALGERETVGVACGDIMFDDLSLYPDYERAVGRMGVPFFQVVGNHDLDLESATDLGSTRTFSRHFGPRYYSFDRGAVHYVVLDDVFWFGTDYMGYLAEDQLTWLAADLATVEPGAPVIVCTHIPVLGGRWVRDGQSRPDHSVSIPNRDALYRLLEPFEVHVLTGHTHEHEHVFEQGVHEHVHGTVCGAWWTGPICWDGTPNGYSVYEIEGESVTWRYKATGRPANHQMRLYGRGADPSDPGRILANVWDWDPEWTVRWFEDGEPRGTMDRITTQDPLSRELHEGPDRPPARGWVDPVPVAHMFAARPAAAAKRLTVEATDRFGRRASDSMAL